MPWIRQVLCEGWSTDICPERTALCCTRSSWIKQAANRTKHRQSAVLGWIPVLRENCGASEAARGMRAPRCRGYDARWSTSMCTHPASFWTLPMSLLTSPPRSLRTSPGTSWCGPRRAAAVNAGGLQQFIDRCEFLYNAPLHAVRAETPFPACRPCRLGKAGRGWPCTPCGKPACSLCWPCTLPGGQARRACFPSPWSP